MSTWVGFVDLAMDCVVSFIPGSGWCDAPSHARRLLDFLFSMHEKARDVLRLDANEDAPRLSFLPFHGWHVCRFASSDGATYLFLCDPMDVLFFFLSLFPRVSLFCLRLHRKRIGNGFGSLETCLSSIQ